LATSAHLGEASAKAEHLLDRYVAVRRQTEALAAPLSAEDQMIQSMPETSPVKWHLAHTTWFYETFILAPHAKSYQRKHPEFEYLFNSYYKQLQGHPLRSRRGLMSRPDLQEVMAYRAQVDSAMRAFLPSASAELLELVELGINHEQQHQELILTDIKHALWSSPLQPAYKQARAEQASAPALGWKSWDEGIYEVGHAGPGFTFDNEAPRHKVYLQSFELGLRCVTNREYLEFMNDGGYEHAELWLSDGWDQVTANSWNAPLYWEQREGEWWNYTASGWCRVEPDEPVCHVSYSAADAYAQWAGARLPTEPEWEVAAAPEAVRGNFLESGRFHPVSSAAVPAAGSQASRLRGQDALPIPGKMPALQQMFGDVWEWTSSAYSAYPGYRRAKGVLGEYNGKFMCNQLVLRGGSCATPQSHIRPTYRNFFPALSRWQFSGIRLAK
jgi:ergothioneine biosynthesis protein EgtB